MTVGLRRMDPPGAPPREAPPARGASGREDGSSFRRGSATPSGRSDQAKAGSTFIEYTEENRAKVHLELVQTDGA